VTSDPTHYTKPINEGPGAIANDSLAAESVRSGGAFSQNRDSQPLDVSGSSSTFNNTNTSGATKLPKAPYADAREGPDRKERYPEALGGQGEFPGAHVPTTGYTGGSTKAKQDLGLQGHQYNTDGGAKAAEASGSDGYKSAYNGGTAPSYVLPVVENVGSTNAKDIRGNNLREGGFDSNPNNNASFTSDIGSNKDPGRAAENKFQRTVAQSGYETGPHPAQTKVEKCAQPYNPLERDQRA
jgi:hypothetical protein